MSKLIFQTLLLAMVTGSSVMAESFSTVEYVTVIKSVPNYSTIQEMVPVQRCTDIQEPISTSGGSNDTLTALVGGAIGGVVGNQFGGGKGKTAATIGGAVLGSLAAQKASSTSGTADTPTTYQVVRKCETVKTYKSRQVLSGYTNFAKFHDKEIQVESDQPIKQIPVTVTYSY